MQSAVVPCGPEHDEPETARARAVFIERTRAHGQHLLNQALSSGCFEDVWAVLESPRYRPHREEIIAAGFGAISSPAGGAAVAKLVESLAQMQDDGRLPRQPWPARLNFAIHLRVAQQHDRLPAAATAGGPGRDAGGGGLGAGVTGKRSHPEHIHEVSRLDPESDNLALNDTETAARDVEEAL
jgi:hypothetical protein